MVLKKILLMLLFVSPTFGDTGFTSTIRVSETDSSPACTVGQIKVSAGTLTCNGQVATVSTGGGGSSLPFLASTSSNTVSSADLEFNASTVGPVLVDSSSCKWRTTITTAGNLVTTLLACPTAPSAPVAYCVRGEPIGLTLLMVCPG